MDIIENNRLLIKLTILQLSSNKFEFYNYWEGIETT
jgi:hypothetical protein